MKIHHILSASLVLLSASAAASRAQTIPRRNGPQIMAMLKATPEGRVMLESAGLSGTTTPAAAAPMQAGAPAGWPAVIDIAEDFSKTLDHTVPIAGHNVDVSTGVTSGGVNQINQKVIVHLGVLSGGIGGSASLTYVNLPAGHYAVAIDVTGAGGTLGASFTTPAGTVPCPPGLLGHKDAQGLNTCAFIYSQAKEGALQFSITATSGAFNLAQVTVARVGP